MHIRPNSSIKTGGITGLYNLEIGVNQNTGSTKYPNVSNLNSFKNYKGVKNSTPTIGSSSTTGTGSVSGSYYNRERESREAKERHGDVKGSSSNIKSEFDSKILSRPLSIQGGRVHGSDDNKYFENNVSSNRYYLQQNYIGKTPNQNLNVNIKSVNVLSNSYAFDKPSLRASDNTYKEKMQTNSFKQAYSPAYLNSYNNNNSISNSQSTGYNDFSGKNKSNNNNNYLVANSKKN